MPDLRRTAAGRRGLPGLRLNTDRPRIRFPGTRSSILVGIDANALDRDGSARDRLVAAFEALVRNGQVRMFIPSGVAAEMTRPEAPEAVRAAALRGIVPASVTPLSARQHIDRIRVRAIMRGDGRPGKHDADAAHLSEAAETGCDYFVTQDGKILRRRDVLRTALPEDMRIATLAELLDALEGPTSAFE